MGQEVMKREKRLFVKEWLPAKKGDHKRPSLDAADLSEIHTITNGIPFRKSPLHCFALCRGLFLQPLRENRVCSPLTNTAFVTILHHLANPCISPSLARGFSTATLLQTHWVQQDSDWAEDILLQKRIAVVCSLLEHHCISRYRIIVNKAQEDRPSSAQSAYWFKL